MELPTIKINGGIRFDLTLNRNTSGLVKFPSNHSYVKRRVCSVQIYNQDDLFVTDQNFQLKQVRVTSPAFLNLYDENDFLFVKDAPLFFLSPSVIGCSVTFTPRLIKWSSCFFQFNNAVDFSDQLSIGIYFSND